MAWRRDVLNTLSEVMTKGLRGGGIKKYNKVYLHDNKSSL